ncbi:cell wall metabolism sensor histidine kinase WalK [Nocardioides sp.]|uniref:sensor histidine kinase n=1 Tax=Nocardioides sp. TaxID=35761 RepID=UPI00272113E9|nr:hybrid sensor histidine kinase/response regulator [Nocardioides sp.]MDO9454519.1 hybrid sensor histidine kinase/response regulator [Nocardioides sp.]
MNDLHLAVLDHSSDLRFLLIEDSSADSELVLALLELEFTNADIHTVRSLDEALTRLRDEPYDLVLADLSLPDADGPTVVRAVRTANPGTALMVLTGRSDGALALWTLAEGAQDYLVKGQHDGPRLATALLHALQRQRAEQEVHGRLVAALHQESDAADRLRELNEAKGEFVATVSHELRTPLTSIAGYVELLQEDVGAGGVSPRAATFVDAIARNAERLSSLAGDLLVLSGFEPHAAPIEMVEVDLCDVVERAREVLATLRPHRPLEVHFVLPRSQVVVLGDAEQLERVVLNLMSNAYKFSEDDGEVVCRLSSEGDEAVLAVTNSGTPIPPDEQARIFTTFFRGSSARERAIQGTGLGLAIVAAIVEQHRGVVSVASGSERETTFSVRLPLTTTGGATR